MNNIVNNTKKRPYKLWSKADVKYVIDNYDNMTAKEIAAHLKRTTGVVLWKACKIGIRKTKKRIFRKKTLGRNTAKERAYQHWFPMIHRCESRKNIYFDSYGGDGVEICPEWHDYEVYKIWFEENDPGGKIEVDRIDNDLRGDRAYSPENCRITDRITNMRNSSVTKLTFDQVIYIHYLVRVIGLQQKDVAKRFGVTIGNISHIINNKSWKDAYAYFNNVILKPALIGK